MRPSPLPEVVGPQRAAVTVGYVAATTPLLAQPVLGGGDTLDTAALQFFLVQFLVERQWKEEERKAAEEEAKKKANQMAKMEGQRMLQIDAMIAEGLVVSEESWWLSCCFLLGSFWEVQEEEEE